MSPPTAPLRVLHIISGDLWAGAEVQAYTLLSNLSKLTGVEVAAVLMNDGELARRLAAAGIAVTILDERRLGVYRIFTQLKTLMRRWRPDVVHTHRSKENVLGSLANRFTHNVAAIRTAHGASERAPRGVKARLRHAVIGALDSWCARHAQRRVIAVSRELGARLAEDFPAEQIVVVENGVDVSAVAAQVAPVDFREAEPDATHVGIVGRLVPVKRVDLFLHSAALLAREEPQRKWRFHVLGDGPLRADLTRLAAELALEPAVRFHGHRSDIVACMAALDVLVMCSDHEGLPMTALEAGVLGVPLVAHAVGGLLDIVPESLLVRAHDAAGYAATMRGVLAADTAAAAAAAAADMSRRVRSDYSSVRNASRIRLLYEQVRAEAGAAT